MAAYLVQRDTRPATGGDLAPLAFAGYAHFTALQAREGLVRGLDLHLARLRSASLRLFGQALPDARVRSALRTALDAGPADVSLTATLYSTAGEFTVPEPDAELSILVRTGPPAEGPAGPLKLTAVPHERHLPTVKHVGEVAKTYYLRQAAARGRDDAAFVDRQGRLSEATIWNLAFWDGTSVVWPRAEKLDGTTMGIVRRQLDRMDVPQRVRDVTLRDLAALSGAVVMNSWTPGVTVREIGSVPLPEAPDFLGLLHRAYRAEPATAP
ncbi:aminotransferase class IV family protein [Streptomyces sp. GSL17-111]|uniref:aminotransferase class IV family protein n=1 Tax=Streptomyces sp. GSL17-111 TaxID=3121596 RepID=UPI0030F3DD1F